MTNVEQMTEEKFFSVDCIVEKVLFFSQETLYGIFSLRPANDENKEVVSLSKYGNFIIKGSTTELVEGKEYTFTLEEAQDGGAHGKYYPLVNVKKESLDTPAKQHSFLKAITTKRQYENIVEVFGTDTLIIDKLMNNEYDLTTVKGIGKKVRDTLLMKIAKEKNAALILIELESVGIEASFVSKIITHYKGNSTLALAEIRQSLYNLTKVKGITFSKVDAFALARGEKLDSPIRIEAYINELLEDKAQGQGDSYLTNKEFLVPAIEALNVNGKVIRNFLESNDNKTFIYFKDSKKLTTISMYNHELTVLKELLRLHNRYEVPDNSDAIVEQCAKELEAVIGFPYSDEQILAAKKTFKNGVNILIGEGGTGKTTVMRLIYEAAAKMGKTSAGCALSGKASNVLLDNGIEPSATIHRTAGLGSGFDREVKIGYDVIFADESSMTNASLFSKLTERIKNRSIIVISGDTEQLSAIGAGDILKDLIANIDKTPFQLIELKKVHRQALESGIKTITKALRDRQTFCSYRDNGLKKYGNNQDMSIVYFQNKSKILPTVEAAIKGQANRFACDQDLLDFQIISPITKRGDLSVQNLNKIAQKYFNSLDKPSVSNGIYDFREGDKIMVKGNTYDISAYESIKDLITAERDEELAKQFEEYSDEEAEEIEEDETTYENMLEGEEVAETLIDSSIKDLLNGTQGIIKSVNLEEKTLIIYFERLGFIRIAKDKLDTIELAYCASVHRLQGSTIKDVLFVLDNNSYSLLSLQLVYTAISRASKRCVCLVETSAFLTALQRDKSNSRKTLLPQIIQEYSLKKIVTPIEETIKTNRIHSAA